MTLDLSPDETAGIVDLFGALTRTELETALDELAFRRNEERPDSSLIDETIESYHIVEYEDVVVVGPTAFPVIPEGGNDLPHIMTVEPQQIDRDRLGRTVEKRFRGDAARAVAAENDERITELLDLSYDLEAWSSVELARARELLVE